MIDLAKGEIAHWLRLEGLPEIRDLAVLPSARRPAALGLSGDDIRRVLAIGPDRSGRRARNGHDAA